MNARGMIAMSALLALAPAAVAHELRPGYLELRETEPDVFALLWKVPARGDQRFGIRPALPTHCTPVAPTESTRTGDAFVERSTVRCAGGLDGHPVAVDGLSATLTDVLLRIERRDGTAQTHRLTPAAPSVVVTAAPGSLALAWTYLRLGVEHILLGFDHLLFVLALSDRGGRRPPLVGTVTAFTVAHSLTLAAATLGLVRVPPQSGRGDHRAQHRLRRRRDRARAGAACRASRRAQPWIVAFAFGLLHGLGFAGALAEVGLPQHAIPLALLCFNVGVEIGQLLFIAAVLGIGLAARRLAIPWPAWAAGLAPYVIGTLAAYWTIERVAAFAS